LKLSSYPTVKEVKEFLLSVIEAATEEKSKLNPSITKREIWDIFFGPVIGKDDNQPYVEHPGKAAMIVEQIKKEFKSLEPDDRSGLVKEDKDKELDLVVDYVKKALFTDGEHHKQWYLYQIAKLLNIKINDVDKGIAP